MNEVTLHTGEQVCSSSEAWRKECEARMVLDMPNLAIRQRYLALVEARRGKDACWALKDVIRAIWKQRQADKQSAA